MKNVDFLEAFLATNPITAPLVIASKVAEAASGKGGREEEQRTASSPPVAPAPTGASPSGGPASNTPDLPTQQPIPPGGASGADLPALIEALMKLQSQEAQATRAAQAAEAAAAREYYPEKARIDIETYRQQADIAAQAGMEKMRENTARQIELQTIDAWQKITQAQINRDTAMGLGMMNLAYAAGVPNPNVLQASASLAGQGRSGFGMPSSVIS
jgi:hypothetical protein